VTGDDATGPRSTSRRAGALASHGVLAWLIALGVLANVAALSPLGNRLADISARIHDTQHGVILVASVVVGAGLRDLARARPWPASFRMMLAALGLAGVVAELAPLGTPGGARHALLVVGGAAIGVALRDGLQSRGESRASRLKASYAPEVYTPSLLEDWIKTGRRQEAKDRIVLPRLVRHFVPGPVLELGAGAGQTAIILRDLGWDVVASDYAPFFVSHLQSLGFRAFRVDATDIGASGLGTFPNIFCQSITPLITSDVAVVARSYRSLYAALQPGGRLVQIHAQAARHELRATMRLHAEQARAAGFQQVRVVRNQLLPSVAYRLPLKPIATLAELAFGRYLGGRFVLTAQRGPAPRGRRPTRWTPRAPIVTLQALRRLGRLSQGAEAAIPAS
jgi:SAM-dependent methyltransferase